MAAVAELRAEYPSDAFEPTMRWYGEQREWQPRFRCNDCSGMVYNTDPANPTDNFRVHLRNAGHRRKVEARLRGG